MDKWKTFAEWNKLGYQIQKGSKATWFENIPKFNQKQVKKSDFTTREYDNYDEMEDAIYDSSWFY